MWLNRKKEVEEKTDNFPQWEEEYLLNRISRYHYVEEYMQMVIQYGYVIFFVAGFPLAPFFALLNNVFELRIDAIKVLQTFKRPIPKRVAGLGAWNGILRGITFAGVITNAYVIAFTGEFIPRLIYAIHVSADMKGFVNSTLSEFSVADYNNTKLLRSELMPNKVKTCFYRGKRYPPHHPKKYNRIPEYWFELAVRLLFIIAFEHLVMVVTGYLAYAISSVPKFVREYVYHEEQQNKQIRMHLSKETYEREKRRFGNLRNKNDPVDLYRH